MNTRPTTDVLNPADLHSSKIGGSSAKRLIMCPGSHRIASKLPPAPSSVYAEEGTLLHSAMAMILEEVVEKPTDVIGLRRGDIVLTRDLYDEMIEPALRIFEDVVDPDGRLEFLTEQRVGFSHQGTLKGSFGTGDLVGVHPTCTIFVDWKFGRGVFVDAEDNAQLKFYAAAARETPAVSDMFDRSKPVECYIVQPAFGEGYSKAVFTHDELDEFKNQLVLTSRMMQDPDAPFKAGDWCKFCPASPACPLKKSLVTEALKTDDTSVLTPEEAGQLLEKLSLLEDMRRDLVTLVQNQLEDGHEVPGWKLVAGKRGARAWTDADDAEKALRKIRKLKVDDIFNKKLKTPTQVEKVLKKIGRTDVLEKFVTQPPGKPTLARADDPAPAILSGVGALAKLSEVLKTK